MPTPPSFLSERVQAKIVTEMYVIVHKHERKESGAPKTTTVGDQKSYGDLHKSFALPKWV